MKTQKLFAAAAALGSVSVWAHPGHEHHALQSSSHFVADSLMVVSVVVVALLIARAVVRKNQG